MSTESQYAHTILTVNAKLSKDAKILAEKYWPTLVVKHTVNGSCNFQRAAEELAELICKELTALKTCTVYLRKYLSVDGTTVKHIQRDRADDIIFNAKDLQWLGPVEPFTYEDPFQ